MLYSTYRYAGTGNPWAGQRRVKLYSKYASKVRLLSPVGNLGLELPTGSVRHTVHQTSPTYLYYQVWFHFHVSSINIVPTIGYVTQDNITPEQSERSNKTNFVTKMVTITSQLNVEIRNLSQCFNQIFLIIHGLSGC